MKSHIMPFSLFSRSPFKMGAVIDCCTRSHAVEYVNVEEPPLTHPERCWSERATPFDSFDSYQTIVTQKV